MDSSVKFLLVLLCIFAMVSEPAGRIYPFYFYSGIIIIAIAFSKIPLLFILKRLMIVMPFFLLAAVFLPISVVVTGESVKFSFDDPWILAGISIFLKASFSVLLLLLLVSSSRFHDLLAGLRKLKIPAIICVLSAIIYRYIFIIADESFKTNLARQSRTPGKLGVNKFKVFGNQASVVFLRSWNRSKTVYASMLSRGFHGEYYPMNPTKLRISDILIFCIFVFVFTGIRFMNEIDRFLIFFNI
jgi:cobalt/nickel transport system permease protein